MLCLCIWYKHKTLWKVMLFTFTLITSDILSMIKLQACPYLCLSPLSHWGGAGGRCTPPSLPFCLLLKIIMRHPYLKILDLVNLFVADAPMKKKSRNLVLPHSQSTLKYGSENRPWVRGLRCGGRGGIQKRFLTTSPECPGSPVPIWPRRRGNNGSFWTACIIPPSSLQTHGYRHQVGAFHSF